MNATEIKQKCSKINEANRCSTAHNGLVAGLSPAGLTSFRFFRKPRLGKPVVVVALCPPDPFRAK
jgi:hypothetical protein